MSTHLCCGLAIRSAYITSRCIPKIEVSKSFKGDREKQQYMMDISTCICNNCMYTYMHIVQYDLSICIQFGMHRYVVRLPVIGRISVSCTHSVPFSFSRVASLQRLQLEQCHSIESGHIFLAKIILKKNTHQLFFGIVHLQTLKSWISLHHNQELTGHCSAPL